MRVRSFFPGWHQAFFKTFVPGPRLASALDNTVELASFEPTQFSLHKKRTQPSLSWLFLWSRSLLSYSFRTKILLVGPLLSIALASEQLVIHCIVDARVARYAVLEVKTLLLQDSGFWWLRRGILTNELVRVLVAASLLSGYLS